MALFLFSAALSFSIELQASHGRGPHHLSAELVEGDVVAYQTATWLVDNVEVGDGSPPCLRLARVDVLQINWTHNCEHGLVRGTALELDTEASAEDAGRVLSLEDEDIDFDPSQLVARLSAAWSEDGLSARLAERLPPDESLLVV